VKSYFEAKKLTKSELLEEYKELLEDYESLESEKESLDEWAGEQENEDYEAYQKLEQLTKPTNQNAAILDIADFKKRLALDNLLSDELEEFIESYLRYYNKID